MIHSMTGYGDAQTQEGGATYRVEIRSLNNRYFKSSIKLPDALAQFETEIDKLLRARLGRGSISYSLRVRDDSPQAACDINASVLGHYVRALQEAAGPDAAVRIDLASLLDVPGVVQPPEVDESVQQARFRIVERLTQQAIDRLIDMRRLEGEALMRDLSAQCGLVRERLAEIGRRAPAVVQEYHARLRTRVQELINAAEVALGDETLAREVALFAERSDVNEEIARLSAHVDQFEELCAAPEESGRKLEFLAQEMLREANTLGSKAGDVQISRQTVEIKAAIDRIKEQVQNVE